MNAHQKPATIFQFTTLNLDKGFQEIEIETDRTIDSKETKDQIYLVEQLWRKNYITFSTCELFKECLQKGLVPFEKILRYGIFIPELIMLRVNDTIFSTLSITSYPKLDDKEKNELQRIIGVAQYDGFIKLYVNPLNIHVWFKDYISNPSTATKKLHAISFVIRCAQIRLSFIQRDLHMADYIDDSRRLRDAIIHCIQKLASDYSSHPNDINSSSLENAVIDYIQNKRLELLKKASSTTAVTALTEHVKAQPSSTNVVTAALTEDAKAVKPTTPSIPAATNSTSAFVAFTRLNPNALRGSIKFNPTKPRRKLSTIPEQVTFAINVIEPTTPNHKS